MLGSLSSRNLMKSSYSLTARGKAVFEWNHNIFNSPRSYGAFTSSTPSEVLKDQTSLRTPAGSSLRGSSTFKNGSTYYSNSYPITNLLSTYSPDAVENNGLTFSASFGECIRVTFYARSSSALSNKIFLHFSEYNGSTLETLGTFSRAFDVDNVDWSFNEIILRVASTNTNTIRIDFSADVSGDYDISDITISTMTQDEYKRESVLKVKNTFKGFRPGDEIAELGPSMPQRISEIVYQTGGKIRGKGSTKIYLPGLDSMNYYAQEIGSGVGVYGIYDKTISTNKIVLKLLNGADSESNFSNKIERNYSLFTLSGTTWTEYHGTQLGYFSENGSIILYWNGTGWSTTPSVATLSLDGSSINGITNIDGIALRVNSMTSSYDDNTVRFLEISPRLSLDLSDYLISFSDSKELDSGSLPIPAGLSTANNASIHLENLPRSYNGSYFSIFSDSSSMSPLSNILKRDVKVKVTYSLIDGDNSVVESDIGFFYGYVDSWTANDVDANIELFDYAKILQDKKVRDILLMSTDNTENSLYSILNELFQQNGFSDYSLADSLKDYHLNAYYLDTQKTIWEGLQELLLPYQHIAYFDNYGTLKIESLSTLNKDKADFILSDTDRPEDGYISNINSLTISKAEKPSEISVRYNTISTKFNTTIVSGDLAKDSVAIQEATEVVWEPSEEAGLGAARLSKTLNPYDKTITLDKSDWKDGIHNWTDYSGYLIIGNEIMRYDGQEVSYTTSSGVTNKVIVKSMQEYKKIQNDVFNDRQISGNQTLSITRTGRLMNVERGLFGTSAGTHYVAGAESLADAPDGIKSGMYLYSKTSRSAGASNITSDLSRYVKSDYHGVNKDKVLRLENSNSGHTILCNSGDSNAIDTYEFTFAYPKDKTSFSKKTENPHNENDYMGIALGFDGSTGQGLFIEFPLKGNTKNMKTSVFFNKNATPHAQSTYKMNLLSKKKNKVKIAIKSKKKKGKAKAKAKTKTVVETTESFNDNYITVSIKLDGKKIKYVKVGNSTVAFKTSNKHKWNGDISSIDRDSKKFGVYVGDKTHIQVFSMNAYNSNSAAPIPQSTDSASYTDIGVIFGSGGFGNEVSTVNIKTDSFVHGMEVFDINFKTGPAFNYKVLKPIGGYEIVDSNGNKVSLFNITENNTDLATASFTPYKGKFILLNKSKTIVPMSGSSMSSLKVVGNVIVKSDELVYKKTISSIHKNSNNIEISSDWIQTEKNAKSLAKEIDKFIKIGLDTYQVEVFGNPLIEIGDIVNLYYTQSGITSDSNYVVIATQNEFDGGFSTTLTLRKIKS